MKYALNWPAIEHNLAQRKPQSIPNQIKTKLIPAAVLVVFNQMDEILFIQRSAHHIHDKHRGQFAFPGGMRDKKDETLVHTALREAHEEVGLPQQNVRIMGQWDELAVPTGFVITPFVALLEKPFQFNLDPKEVAQAFWLNMKYFTENKQAYSRPVLFQELVRAVWHYPTPKGKIWGATATIIHDLLDFCICL